MVLLKSKLSEVKLGSIFNAYSVCSSAHIVWQPMHVNLPKMTYITKIRVRKGNIYKLKHDTVC
jgi:hypothetical protein